MQQQQLQITSDTAGVARVGLARSRHATQGNDQPSKKHKKTSFAHNETTEIQTSDGSKILKCNHCTERVSSNISRRKEHLLICKAFLASAAAARAAEKDNDLRKAHAAFR
jgi:hypothetical protein